MRRDARGRSLCLSSDGEHHDGFRRLVSNGRRGPHTSDYEALVRALVEASPSLQAVVDEVIAALDAQAAEGEEEQDGQHDEDEDEDEEEGGEDDFEDDDEAMGVDGLPIEAIVNILGQFGLPTEGTEQELRDRLQAHVEQLGAAQGGAGDDSDEDE